MDDQVKLLDEELKQQVNNGTDLQKNHFEWEKQYLNIFFRPNFSKNPQWETDSIELFEQQIENHLNNFANGVENFITYLQAGRQGIINFDDEELKILENNQDLKSVLAEFHTSVGIIIQKEVGKKNEEDFIDYFKNLDLNIQAFLNGMLEDLLSTSPLKCHIQMLQKLQKDDAHTFQYGKSAYNKQKNIQQSKELKKCFTILIIGAVGAGKSRLAEQLLIQLYGKQNKEIFIEGDQIQGVTKNLNRVSFSYQDKIIELIDTPGCGDLESGLKLVFDELLSQSIKINLILFCMNAQILRLHRQDLCFLSIIQGVFNCQWENFFICLNFMEKIQIEQIKSDSIINSFEKRLKIKLPEQNIIIENDTKIKINKILQIIQQFISSKNKKSFKLRFIPDWQFIRDRLNQYKA